MSNFSTHQTKKGGESFSDFDNDRFILPMLLRRLSTGSCLNAFQEDFHDLFGDCFCDFML